MAADWSTLLEQSRRALASHGLLSGAPQRQGRLATGKERRILALLRRGYAVPLVAATVRVSERTVMRLAKKRRDQV